MIILTLDYRHEKNVWTSKNIFQDRLWSGLSEPGPGNTPGPSIVFSRRMVVGRPADGRRTVVDGARVVSGAEKKAFDRGGPIWPPRSNAADDRLGGGLGELCPPQPKIGGSGGQRSPAKIEQI